MCSDFIQRKELSKTPLRRRILDDMQIRNFSENTQKSYLMQGSLFARHFRRSGARAAGLPWSRPFCPSATGTSISAEGASLMPFSIASFIPAIESSCAPRSPCVRTTRLTTSDSLSSNHLLASLRSDAVRYGRTVHVPSALHPTHCDFPLPLRRDHAALQYNGSLNANNV
jgi:hypothetical protein